MVDRILEMILALSDLQSQIDSDIALPTFEPKQARLKQAETEVD
jgi:hypothetical protein